VPAPHPLEFRHRAVAELAKDLRISESCLRNWLAQAEADESDSETAVQCGGGDPQAGGSLFRP
jgi:transposase-like protein